MLLEAERGQQGRARTQEVGGNGRVSHARSVPRVAPTWRNCLTTQLEQERRRKSACEQGCGNGLRAHKKRTLQAGAYVARLK